MGVKRTKQGTSTDESKAKPRRVSKRRTARIGHDEIAVRAYFIHLEDGGDPYENWLRAERELLAA
jgi:DUF2934 family protein